MAIGDLVTEVNLLRTAIQAVELEAATQLASGSLTNAQRERVYDLLEMMVNTRRNLDQLTE